MVFSPSSRAKKLPLTAGACKPEADSRGLQLGSVRIGPVGKEMSSSRARAIQVVIRCVVKCFVYLPHDEACGENRDQRPKGLKGTNSREGTNDGAEGGARHERSA
jgi:hypothetical protein